MACWCQGKKCDKIENYNGISTINKLLKDCNYKDGERHGRCMSWRGEGIYENGVEIEYESYLIDQSVEFKGFK